MILTSAHAKILLEKYHEFDDGLVKSFEYRHADNGPPSADVILYARNHESPDNEWNHVAISMKNVDDLCVTVSQKQFLPILLGVRIIDFVHACCIDVDGNYASTLGPHSLTEVRKLGDFYFIGKEISLKEIREKDAPEKQASEQYTAKSLAENINILSESKNFINWKLISFSCHQETNEFFTVRIIVRGKKIDTDGKVATSIEIILHDAHDAHIKLSAMQFAPLISGIRLLQFGGLYCIDIDGAYADGNPPHSFAELKKSANCYALGGSVTIKETLDLSPSSTK